MWPYAAFECLGANPSRCNFLDSPPEIFVVHPPTCKQSQRSCKAAKQVHREAIRTGQVLLRMKLSKISSLSAYARPEAHLTKQTLHGAIVTLSGALLATILFFHELGSYLNDHETKMDVDLARRHEITINMNITFVAVPCADVPEHAVLAVLSIDALDMSGTSDSDVAAPLATRAMHIHKVRLDGEGRHIGKKEYHTPESQQAFDAGGETLMTINVREALKHVEEMEDEYSHHEGCNVHGTIVVKRVAGRIVMSIHRHQVFAFMPQLLGDHHIPDVNNISHIVHKMTFGPTFPGQVNPLDGFTRTVVEKPQSFRYFLKVVPTEFLHYTGRTTETHQYSVTEYAIPVGIDEKAMLSMQYDLSPIVVSIRERPYGFLHFVVRLCAVVGGAFAITGILDKWVNAAVNLIVGGPAPSS